jgi:hypothetical protein
MPALSAAMTGSEREVELLRELQKVNESSA